MAQERHHEPAPCPAGDTEVSSRLQASKEIKSPLFTATSVEIFVCVCACVCALASNLALVTQHTWAARPFLSAGASSSSQGPRRRMKREQMVWGCSQIPAPRAVSSAARALWRAQHAQDQRGLSEDPGGGMTQGAC